VTFIVWWSFVRCSFEVDSANDLLTKYNFMTSIGGMFQLQCFTPRRFNIVLGSPVEVCLLCEWSSSGSCHSLGLTLHKELSQTHLASQISCPSVFIQPTEESLSEEILLRSRASSSIITGCGLISNHRILSVVGYFGKTVKIDSLNSLRCNIRYKFVEKVDWLTASYNPEPDFTSCECWLW